jgi:pSer/pThr/pTyr-binding forkhead associated (FHA) protein
MFSRQRSAGGAKRMALWLHHLGAVCVAHEICLDRFPFVIGRRKESDGHLPLAFISRTHCQFICTDNQIMIQDLESYNGTFVNGQRVTEPRRVKDGDEITLGPISFRLVIPPSWQETTATHTPATQPEIANFLS